MSSLWIGLCVAAAGAATVIQSAANAGLATRIGLPAALVVNTSIVLAAALVYYFARGSSGTFFPPETPWSYYVGGLCGFAVILSLALAFPRIGAGVAIALVVLGQGAAALAIDHFGLLGMPTEPVTVARIAGLVLVGGGIVLIRT